MTVAQPSPSNDSVFDRRHFLRGSLALGGGVLASGGPLSTIARAQRTTPAGSDLGAIEHVVFVMQENRSFDNYFGSYKGVLGFNDHAGGSLGAFAQAYPANKTHAPFGEVLPFHLDSSNGHSECTHDIDHSWRTQHLCWNNGAMDSFVKTHTQPQIDGPTSGLLTMGYYTRADLPFHYALADAFTLCDRYHCSILAPTHPNRLMALSGTIDPAGHHGGPVLTTETASRALFSVNWTTVPELLEDAGVSWKTYTPPGQGFIPSNPELGFGDAILPYFSQYKRPSSPLYQKAFLPTYPAGFSHDVRTGQLPNVSWIVSPNGYDEHPPSAPGYGAWFLNNVLRTLTSNKKVWSKTVLFITYDENDGFFDHVAPPFAPPGTPGEYLSVNPLPPDAEGVSGPLGLGFRVPMLVVSPFSRGGYVSSDVFDHTSQIRFLEQRFGIHANNISAWRRSAVGDLTATLHMKSASVAVPALPSTVHFRAEALGAQGCTPSDINETSTAQGPYPLPATQTMPTQEPGTARRLPPTSG
ncbi:MAG TPA: alkaline phosphatase family protein [Acidimicrobiales bacterium]|nr:alkaline phosphatase family protein [Acidimicrobiales bacterium]